MAAPVAFSLPSSPPPGAAPRSAPPRGVIVGICVLLVVVVAVVLWRRGRGGGGPLTPCSASRPCPEGQVCQCAGVDAGFCIPFPGGTPAAGYAWVSGWSSPVRDRAGCVAECAGRAVSAGAAHWAYYEGGGSPGGAPVGSSPNCVYGELKGGCALAAPGWTSDGGAVAAACPPDKVCPCGGTHAGKCVEPASVGVAPGYAWAWDEAMDDYTRSHAACATECASKAAAGGGSNWTYTGLVSAPGGPGGGPTVSMEKSARGLVPRSSPGALVTWPARKPPPAARAARSGSTPASPREDGPVSRAPTVRAEGTARAAPALRTTTATLWRRDPATAAAASWGCARGPARKGATVSGTAGCWGGATTAGPPLACVPRTPGTPKSAGWRKTQGGGSPAAVSSTPTR